MHASEKTALVRRLIEEVWNQHDAEAAKAIVSEDYTSIENITFPATPGPEKVAAEVEFYASIYTDLHFDIQRMFAEGDTVVTTWTASGVSVNETFMNRAGHIEPKTLRAFGTSLAEVKDGRVQSHSFFWPRHPLFP